MSEAEQKQYHLILTDQAANSVKLLLCDNRGNTDGRRFGRSLFPRTALQMRQGGAGYEDMELPFITLAQKDWAGGIGNKIFEKDKSRYLWGWGVDTSRGPIIKGPKVTTDRTAAYGNENEVLDYTHCMRSGVLKSAYIKFTAVREITDVHISVALKWGWTITVALRSDNAGAPGAVIVTNDYARDWGEAEAYDSETEKFLDRSSLSVLPMFTFSFDTTLSADTDYWLELKTTYNHYSSYVGVIYDPVDDPETEVNNLYYYVDAETGYDFSTDYRVPIYVEGNNIPEQGTYRTKYFEYKGALYKVVMETESGAPKLYLNGWRGVAGDNTGALNKFYTQQAAMADDAATGAVVKILAGKIESEPERVVMGHEESTPESGVFDVLIMDRAWKRNHSGNATEYVIQGADVWNEITGHGLTKPVVDVLVVNDIVYFSQGTDVAMRRMREYNNSGTWTRQWAADGTNMFDDLVNVWETDGKSKVYASKRSTGVISVAEVKNWGTDLTFSKEVRCGYGKITNMIAYGTPRRCYIFKTDEVGYISNNIYQPLPLAEMENVESRLNGQAAVVSDVYLYFTMGSHIQRYYDGRLDDMGPDRDEGLPRSKRGLVTALCAYPGRLICAVDGGATGNSSILLYNGYGWDCVFTTKLTNTRITDLHVESVPGRIDRLWFNDGQFNAWLGLTWNPKQEKESYEYASTGGVITSWMEGNFSDIDKYWHSVQVFGEGISTINQVTIAYQTEADGENTWHDAGTIDANGEELLFTSDYSLSGKRLRMKIEFVSTDDTQHMQIDAVLVQEVERLPVKWQYPITFILNEDALDLVGRPTKMSVEDMSDQLVAWMNVESTPLPLTVSSNLTELHNKVVFLDQLSIDMLEQEMNPRRKAKYLCSANLLEV